MRFFLALRRRYCLGGVSRGFLCDTGGLWGGIEGEGSEGVFLSIEIFSGGFSYVGVGFVGARSVARGRKILDSSGARGLLVVWDLTGGKKFGEFLIGWSMDC